MNPRVDIYLDKLRHNTATLLEYCEPLDINIAAVTKGFCGDVKIAGVLAEAGVRYLADSRIDNLIKEIGRAHV